MDFDTFLTALQEKMLKDNINWDAGITLWSHHFLKDEDAKKVLNGAIPSKIEGSIDEQKEKAKKNFQEFKDKGPGNHPPAFDWRNVEGYNFVTPVKNQRICASCVAFAVAAALETKARIKLRLPVNVPANIIFEDLSEAQLLYCNNSNCSKGLVIPKTLDFCKTKGVVPESCFPYEVYSDDPNCNLCRGWENKVTQISGYTKLDNHQKMKKWISSRGPVVASMEVCDDFFLYNSRIYKHVLGNGIGIHAVCCIGYDDIKNAWLCKNSMGTDWGMNGYFWITYGDCGIDSHMFGIDGFSKIYTIGSKK